MNKRKAFFFTLWGYSFLVWLYVITRIIVNNVWWEALFIDYIPIITFEKLGITAFLLSALSLYLFLKEET